QSIRIIAKRGLNGSSPTCYPMDRPQVILGVIVLRRGARSSVSRLALIVVVSSRRGTRASHTLVDDLSIGPEEIFIYRRSPNRTVPRRSRHLSSLAVTAIDKINSFISTCQSRS